MNSVSNMTNTEKCETVCSAEWMKTDKEERDEEIDRYAGVVENVISFSSLLDDCSFGSSFGQEPLNDETCDVSIMTNTQKCDVVC